MATRAKVKKKSGYEKGRLLVFTPETIRQIVSRIPKRETLSSVDESNLNIIRDLQEIFGTKVILEPVVDPSIIGVIVVKVGDKTLDGSLRSKPASLKRVPLGKDAKYHRS